MIKTKHLFRYALRVLTILAVAIVAAYCTTLFSKEIELSWESPEKTGTLPDLGFEGSITTLWDTDWKKFEECHYLGSNLSNQGRRIICRLRIPILSKTRVRLTFKVWPDELSSYPASVIEQPGKEFFVVTPHKSGNTCAEYGNITVDGKRILPQPTSDKDFPLGSCMYRF
jgi:hypothetical protein